MLLGRHAGHVGLGSHAAVLWRRLGLLRAFEVAALLHLLLDEHGMLIEARRWACRSTLGGASTEVMAGHRWLVVSRHLRRRIAQQLIIDQTRWRRCARLRRVRLRRLTNPKVEVLVWTTLLLL